MPILENLAEGFANAAGATGAAQSIENNKAHRQKLSDAALEDTVQAHVDVMKGIQAKLGQEPNNQQLQQQLAQERQQLFNLLHSNEQSQPGKVAQLFRHIFRQKDQPQQQPVNNLPSVENMTAAAPSGQDEYAGLSPEDKIKAIRIKYKLDPGATADKNTPTKYLTQADVFTTKDKQGEMHYWRIPSDPDEKPNEVDFQGQELQSKGGGKLAKFDEMAEAYARDHNIQGGRAAMNWNQLNYVAQKISYDNARAGSSVAYKLVQDQNHNWIPVEETSTKGIGPEPIDPLGQSAPSGQRKPLGEQRNDLNGMKNKHQGASTGSTEKSAFGGHVKVGDPVAKAPDPVVSAAKKDWVAAVKIATIADDVEKKPNDAFNQKRLAVALERLSAGRFTTQALDYIKQVGWGATIEQWANNVTTGALPENLMRQLVDGARQNLAGAQKAYDAARGGPSGDDLISVQIPGQAPGKIHGSQLKAFLKKYPNATVTE